MKKFLLALLLLSTICSCFADSRVFTLVNPHPEEVVESLRNTYGDKIQADIVQGRLLVVGSKQQLDEIGALLTKLDPSPRALRLMLREQPPADENAGTITYSTNRNGYIIDTVEGAFVAIDYQQFAQQVSGIGIDSQDVMSQSASTGGNSKKISRKPGNGWWVEINNAPTRIDSLTLRVALEGGRRAIVLVSYTKQENQERKVFGNTVAGNLGTWIPLLPRRSADDDGTISSGPKPGEQLYLRVDKNLK